MLLVIVDHLLAYPSGGFVGVDVFFVISGFVITASLIREHERSGKISFWNFYRRRARRILPLATLVIVLTLVTSWAIFSTVRFIGIAQNGLWSLLSVGNWHFALAGTNYMQADGVASPLQHFWSLAVEEQFYVAWPWLTVLMLGLLATRRCWSAETSRSALALAMGAVMAGTFIFAMWETSTSPTFAYFSTFSRAWELAGGGLLAVLSPALLCIPDRLRPILAYGGLTGILGGAFLITPQMSFPGPWAALPVIATMLVIAAGTGGEQRYLQLLTNRAARYLGDISYSLYLWHFPVIVLLEALNPSTGLLEYAVALAVTFGLSAWSYRFVEEPIRHSKWLERNNHRQVPHEVAGRLAFGALTALALVTAILVSFALAQSTPAPASAVQRPMFPSASASPAANTPAARLGLNIQTALSTHQWPELTPAIDTLGVEAKVPEWVQDGCLADERGAAADPKVNALRCIYGESHAPKTAVVLGDSIAISYVPAVRAALEPQGYKILVYTMQQCPSVDVAVVKEDKSSHPKCAPFRQWTMDQMKILKPDLVLTANALGNFDRLASGAKGAAAMSECTAGSKALLTVLQAHASRVVVLDPPPGGQGCH